MELFFGDGLGIPVLWEPGKGLEDILLWGLREEGRVGVLP